MTEYGYDSQQRLAWLRHPDGLVTSYERNASEEYERISDGTYNYRRFTGCGQALETRDHSGNVSRFEWDTEQWRMLSYQDARGGVHRFEYDADGNLTSHAFPGGSLERYEWKSTFLHATVDRAGKRVEFEYDDLGYLTKKTSEDGVIEYEFDPKHCDLAKLTHGESVVAFEHDEFGVLSSLRTEGVKIDQRYEARDRLAEFTTSLGDHAQFEYDSNGLLASADFGFCRQRFGYDASGRQVGRDLIGAGKLRMRRDVKGRLLEQVFEPSAAPLALAAGGEAFPSTSGYSRSYTFSGADRLSRMVDTLRGWRRFVHGPSLELMAVDESTGTTDFYNYDAAGNRQFAATVSDNHQLLEQAFHPTQPVPWSEVPAQALLRGGTDRQYRYDADNQLLEVRSYERILRFEYDNAGFVTAKHVVTNQGQATWRFHWNAFGWLTSLETPTGERWSYRYDGAGRRVAKTSPQDETTRYVWHEGSIIYELRGDSASFYGNHPEADELLAVRADQPLHVVSDHAGAPAELISLDGQVKGLLHRDSWGKRLDPETLPHIFPGQFRDDESGLSYNNQRYYDPEVGRYLSPDPFGLLAGTNWYTYPSPELFIDPEGAMRRGTTILPGQGTTVNSTAAKPTPKKGDEPPTTAARGGSVTHDDGRGGTTTTDLGKSTLTTVSPEGGAPVNHTLNGRPCDQSTDEGRSLARDNGANSTTWWHSEQNAMAAVMRGDIQVPGDGPIRFDISRTPCERSCMGHMETFAQDVATKTQRQVIVTFPVVEDGQVVEKTIVKAPGPKDCG